MLNSVQEENRGITMELIFRLDFLKRIGERGRGVWSCEIAKMGSHPCSSLAIRRVKHFWATGLWGVQ